MEWDADYDGKIANMSLDVNNNGNKQHYSLKLDNDDLATILNIPSIQDTLDMRLKRDFRDFNMYEPKMIELDPASEQSLFFDKSSLLTDNNIQTHISSPLPYEELIIPLKINPTTSKSYTLTPKKRHKKRKNHKTHRVYKHKKTSSRRSKNSSGSSHKTRRSSIPRL